jgi:hypothetical protein
MNENDDGFFGSELNKLWTSDIKHFQLKAVNAYLNEINRICCQAIKESQCKDKPIDLIYKALCHLRDNYPNGIPDKNE